MDLLFASPVITIYCSVVIALLGLIMGSFLGCWAWRSMHGESVVTGRSHCDTCGHVLGPRDLVPVLSWLSTGGKCRYCGAHISAVDPVSELVLAAVYVTLLLRYGLTLELVQMLVFASLLFLLSLTDLSDYTIPNWTIVALIVTRLAYIAAAAALGQADGLGLLVQSLGGGLAITVPLIVVMLVMDHVLGRESLGGGDVKLFFVSGLYFGWQQGLFLIILACILGLAFFALGGALSHRHAGDSPDGVPERAFPFGPAIALACWITALIGYQVLTWYLSLLI